MEIAPADALRPETLAAALDGVDVARYLVHSMAAGRDFARLDLKAARNFARAAEAAGVGRSLDLGGLVPANADSAHIVSRRETGEVLRRGRVPVTGIRAGIIVGPGSAAFEVMRDFVFHLPVMINPRWVRAKSPPIALENLLEYLVRAPAIDATAGKVLDAAGPETLSYEQMMRIVAEVAGRSCDAWSRSTCWTFVRRSRPPSRPSAEPRSNRAGRRGHFPCARKGSTTPFAPNAHPAVR